MFNILNKIFSQIKFFRTFIKIKYHGLYGGWVNISLHCIGWRTIASFTWASEGYLHGLGEGGVLELWMHEWMMMIDLIEENILGKLMVFPGGNMAVRCWWLIFVMLNLNLGTNGVDRWCVPPSFCTEEMY